MGTHLIDVVDVVTLLSISLNVLQYNFIHSIYSKFVRRGILRLDNNILENKGIQSLH